MASNLLLGFNQIPLSAIDVTTSNTTSDFYPFYNLLSNNKSHWITFTSSVTTNTFWFDLGSGNTQTADFFALPFQFIDTSNSFSVDLEGSNNNTTWTTVLAVSESDLIAGADGFYLYDYIDTFATSTAYRYWRVVVTDDTASNAFTGAFSKFFFGNIFDIGSDPDQIKMSKEIQEKRFTTDSGLEISQQGYFLKHRIEIVWNNITDAKASEFIDLYKLQDNPLVYLYATNNNDFFSGVSLISANITDLEIERWDDFNRISLVLSEAI